MKLVNFGSLNIDRVYQVPHFVRPGETILARNYQCFAGGKGLNQSIAAARAGVQVIHAGAVGADGGMLLDTLSESGVDASQVLHSETATGHAVIQVDSTGQNCIIVLGGANQELTRDYVDGVLASCDPEDIVLMQNETSLVPYVMEQAYSRGFRIAFNPSPADELLLTYPMEYVTWLILNEVEGAQLTGLQGASDSQVLQALVEKYPQAEVVLTVGERGVLYAGQAKSLSCPACKVHVVDTTGAGDTFCGYFLACTLQGMGVEECLERATRASAIAISRAGASVSIPRMDEVAVFRPTW